MEAVSIRELKQRTSAILRRVREAKEVVAITYRGRVVARLVPVETQAEIQADALKVWAELDELALEVGTHWPEGVSAAEAVAEQRRAL